MPNYSYFCAGIRNVNAGWMTLLCARRSSRRRRRYFAGRELPASSYPLPAAIGACTSVVTRLKVAIVAMNTATNSSPAMSSQWIALRYGAAPSYLAEPNTPRALVQTSLIGRLMRPSSRLDLRRDLVGCWYLSPACVQFRRCRRYCGVWARVPFISRVRCGGSRAQTQRGRTDIGVGAVNRVEIRRLQANQSAAPSWRWSSRRRRYNRARPT